LRAELGLTPQSLGQLLSRAASVAAATNDETALAALRAEGQQILAARADRDSSRGSRPALENGAQEARRVVVADPLALLGAMVLDNGRRWGELATVMQRENAEAVLTPGDPRLHWCEWPKGHSKSTDAGCLSAVWLLEQADELAEGYVVSSDEDQSNRLLDRARGVIRRTSLESVLRVESKRISNVRTGARVVALAADVSSSEGLLSPWYVIDELPRWKTSQSARDMWTSVFSGVPKVPGARLLVLGHAGDPAHWSFRIREQARMSPRWRFLRVDGPTPWLEPGDLEEQRALLLPSQYAQWFLNLWTAGEDRLAERDDVSACVGDHDLLGAPSTWNRPRGPNLRGPTSRTGQSVPPRGPSSHPGRRALPARTDR
jgi:hypothetical protein